MSKREHDVEPPARALAAGADVERPGSCEQLDRREPSIFLFSEFRCGPIDGARAVELFAATGSLHIGAGRQRTGRGALRHALASTFPAGAIVVFIPWCRGAEPRAGESTASMTRSGIR